MRSSSAFRFAMASSSSLLLALLRWQLSYCRSSVSDCSSAMGLQRLSARLSVPAFLRRRRLRARESGGVLFRVGGSASTLADSVRLEGT